MSHYFGTRRRASLHANYFTKLARNFSLFASQSSRRRAISVVSCFSSFSRPQDFQPLALCESRRARTIPSLQSSPCKLSQYPRAAFFGPHLARYLAEFSPAAPLPVRKRISLSILFFSTLARLSAGARRRRIAFAKSIPKLVCDVFRNSPPQHRFRRDACLARERAGTRRSLHEIDSRFTRRWRALCHQYRTFGRSARIRPRRLLICDAAKLHPDERA